MPKLSPAQICRNQAAEAYESCRRYIYGESFQCAEGWARAELTPRSVFETAHQVLERFNEWLGRADLPTEKVVTIWEKPLKAMLDAYDALLKHLENHPDPETQRIIRELKKELQSITQWHTKPGTNLEVPFKPD